MLLYFAGPLFSTAEKRFNLQLTFEIEKAGYEVFLPQRDGFESTCNLSKNEIRNKIFSLDREKVFDSDVFLFILDGRIPDEGACVELGLAYAHKQFKNGMKKIIGFQTDLRTSSERNRLNPMIEKALDKIIVDDESLLLTELKNFLKENNPV